MDLKRPIFFLHIFCGFLFSQAFNGMTLFSPIQGNTSVFTTFLIDNDLNVIQSWTHPRGAASMPYLMRNGLLYYPYRVQNPSMNNGGVGGGFSIYGWDGELQWSYELANSDYQHHHDIEPLENGNFLLIAWELKTADEAYAVGRQSIDNVLNVMWSEAIIEYEMLTTKYPENAIVFPQHKTPAIAGAPANNEGFKIDLSLLFGQPDAAEMAAQERDEQLVLAGRSPVEETPILARRQSETTATQPDQLDELIDGLDTLDL
mgnify:CR=1 FL=1